MTSTLSNIFFVVGFCFIIFFLYSLSKHRNRVSGLFSLMCLSIAIYVIGYGFELRAQDGEQIMFFLKLEYFGAPFMTAFWLLFSYKFYYNRNPSLRLNIMVMLIPVLTLFFSVTNEYHHLFYADVSAVQYDGFIIARLTKGPWYFVNMVYSYLVLLVGAAAFYKAWRHSLYMMRTQSLLLFIGTLCPGIINIVYLAGFSPYGLDLTPFGLSVLAVLYYIALFRYEFLELGEIIRSVAFSEISEGIIVVDDKRRVIDFNNAAQKVFSCLEPKNIGMDLASFEETRRLAEQKSNSFEMKVDLNGYQKYYEFRVTDLKEKDEKLGSVFFMRDITKQKEIIRALDHMASYDPLTQVYNRRRLVEEAEKEALRVKRLNICLSVLMMDIDFFKKVNDVYGHLAGDEVIRSVANACKERVRRTDIIGRYGGEEFVILLPGSDLEDALDIAEEIRKHIEEMEIVFFENRIKVTVSIGVASAGISKEETNIMQVINNADMALYHAKNNGRNRVSG